MTNEEQQRFKQTLLDAIFDNPSIAFPEFDWQQNTHAVGRYGKYTSSKHLSGRDSTDNNRHQLYIKDGNNDAHAIIADENGDSIEVLKLWEQTNGERFPNCPDLCGLYNIETPQQTTPEQRKHVEQMRNESEQLLAQMRADYMGPAGVNVRNYLSAPQAQGGRGYTPDVVEKMGQYIGVVTQTTAEQLAKVTGLPIPRNVAAKYPLAIPTISKKNGTIQYVKFRTIDPNAAKEYKWHNPRSTAPDADKLQYYYYYPNEQGPKGRDDVDPYNFNNTNFAVNESVVVVESEICAAHATAKGIRNVIALRGSDGVKQKLVRRLVNERCKNIILLLDTDEHFVEHVAKAIQQIRKATGKITISVARIPDAMGAKDPDELLSLRPEDGADLLQNFIESGERPFLWEAMQHADRYNNAQTNEEREQIENEVINHAGEIEQAGDIIESEKYLYEFTQRADVRFDGDALKRAATAKAQQAAAEQYKKRKEKAFDELAAAREKNDERGVNDALETLLEIRPPQDDPELKQQGRDLFDVFAELYHDSAADLTTNYELYSQPIIGGPIKKIPMKLYANGISYIAGGTSHGKSTVLQNIAVDLLEQGKRVLFYGFEEIKRNTIFELLNIYIHRRTGNAFGSLSINGTDWAVNEYFRTRNVSSFDLLPEIDRPRAAQLIAEFFGRFRGTNGNPATLFVYDDGLTSSELVGHVDEKSAIIHPDAIFIDYVQYLVSEPDNPKAAQWEDLGRVSKDIITINKRSAVPVVAAAQLKTKNNPKSAGQYRHDDIFGASSIAQGAASIFIVENSSKYEKDINIDYFGTDTPFGQRGKLYIRLDKNRFGTCPAMAIYDYDGEKRFVNYDTLARPDLFANNNDKNTPI